MKELKYLVAVWGTLLDLILFFPEAMPLCCSVLLVSSLSSIIRISFFSWWNHVFIFMSILMVNIVSRL